MRERSQTTPRRRRAGPKQPLPSVESPYNIDNTEDIYGTTLLPSQRCYVDPWDLENYDYVRKKIDAVDTVVAAPIPDYETALDYEREHSSSQSSSSPIATSGYGMIVSASTMPRPHTRHQSRSQCQLECCRLPANRRSRSQRKEPLYAARSELYGAPPSRYDDYMATMTRQLQLDDDVYQPEELYAEQRQLYNGYGGGLHSLSLYLPLIPCLCLTLQVSPAPARRSSTPPLVAMSCLAPCRCPDVRPHCSVVLWPVRARRTATAWAMAQRRIHDASAALPATHRQPKR